MVAIPVHELDLPLYDAVGVDREQRLALMAAAREESWLARTPIGFALTRYDDAVAILRDRRFHSALSMIPQLQGLEDTYIEQRRPSILSMEGQPHTRLRRLVAPAFTPMAAERLRPFMREVIATLVDAVQPTGRCDLVADVCEPYPIHVICELLGAPRDDWPRFSQWATDIFRIFNQNLAEDLPAIQRASTELETYVHDLVEQRRRAPGDDLLSALIAAEEAGDRLSTDELVMLAEAVLMAGTDTTRNQLACCIALFAAEPEQWRRFVAQPELAPRVVEETMRYLGAVQGTMRIASQDIEYRDVVFPAGTLVSISLAGANRDPDVFTSAERLDVARETSAPHMTFGSGIHHCLGAHLARAELQEALTVIAERLPEFELDGPVSWKPEQFGIWGPARLPLRWTV
ncbi:MAG TPA: cytochrome P450 [Acidimicrobiia bacterium]|nr:cytochrome P450 [Acidimicrobiia bacterium]